MSYYIYLFCLSILFINFLIDNSFSFILLYTQGDYGPSFTTDSTNYIIRKEYISSIFISFLLFFFSVPSLSSVLPVVLYALFHFNLLNECGMYFCGTYAIMQCVLHSQDYVIYTLLMFPIIQICLLRQSLTLV